MNKEILDRLMTAKAYQKKAIYALFPEEMSVHLDAIEKAIRAMAVEVIATWLQDEHEKDGSGGVSYENSTDGGANNSKSRNDNFHQPSGTKKIDIT